MKSKSSYRPLRYSMGSQSRESQYDDSSRGAQLISFLCRAFMGAVCLLILCLLSPVVTLAQSTTAQPDSTALAQTHPHTVARDTIATDTIATHSTQALDKASDKTSDKTSIDSLVVKEQRELVVTDSVTVSSTMRRHRQAVADGLHIADVKTAYSADGSALVVSFVARYGERVVASREALLVTPVYVQPEALGEVRLPQLRINGRQRARAYRREVSFWSHQEYEQRKPLLLTTIATPRHMLDTITNSARYSYRMPLANYKTGGSLRLDLEVEDCCKLYPVASKDYAIAPHILPAPDTVRIVQTVSDTVRIEAPKPLEIARPDLYASNVSFIRPAKEEAKVRSQSLSVRITFEVAKAEVLPNFANNRAELTRVDREIRPLLTDHDSTYTVREASIYGYASPEGGYEYNRNLSESRAYGFRNYLERIYGMSRIPTFDVQGRSEDWEGLRKHIVESSLPERDEILRIIDRESISYDARDQQLKRLRGGRTYKTLLGDIYPLLRRIDMTLQYGVRDFEQREVATIIETRPQDLSQREIYDLAHMRNSDAVARTQRSNYGREYDIAARYFPKDAIAQINASSAALIRGELEIAHLYLERVAQDPRAYNNLGVYHWMRQEYDQAADYFRRVPQESQEMAQRNLTQMLQEQQQRKALQQQHKAASGATKSTTTR
ncbi:hypothetical protein Poras_0858 [Porphyromonas asaccharolytica DSM 20707]|uniref:DUF3868 domain-containing protein n=2 Tax=Porphyromonas asaccharolytica TaxID=28123 RepID=F4KK76_PORAD|nr:hypothetical protein Poras_0858 [Porphyromonas asaccharolytica DSM 20707]